MSLASQLSTALADRYRIVSDLGAGGMATVYLAEDLKHERKVALKVLRPELAAVIGAERFLQEIKVTANLQHPHILPLHDSGQAASFLFYVMPYVEGDTLRNKLDREKQLDITEAIEIARGVASALDYAHRQGVIHRDIKPENILLHDRQALVADFGIALAMSHAGGQRLTETGLSIGTPHYMSPEQAMGDRELDSRSDVYSLGAMLYEMLAGQPPYQGNSAQAIVAKVITEKAPPVTAHRDTVPGHVAAAIAKALQKMPADRFKTAAGFADALMNTAFTAPGTASVAPPDARALAGHARFVWPALAAGFALVAAWAWIRPGAAPTPEPVVRYELPVPGMDGGLLMGFGSSVAISPDGRRLAYSSADERGSRLWLRERNNLEVVPVPGGEGALQLWFAPDGDHLGVITDSRALRVISLIGEPPITLVESGMSRSGGSWSDDGFLYFADRKSEGRGGLARMPATGGPVETVTVLDPSSGEVSHQWPSALPGGRGVVFTAHRVLYDAESAEIGVVDPATGEERRLLKGVMALWSRTGHLVVVRADGSLVAAPFDLRSLTVTGPAMPLLGGVGIETLGSADVALSTEGTLVYQRGLSGSGDQQISWVTPEGTATPVDSSWLGRYGPGRLSPDGTRFALEVHERGTHIWIKQLNTGPATKMTFEGTVNQLPSWSPDGRDILFISNQGANADVYRRPVDGSTPPQLVLDHERPVLSAALAADGRWLVYGLGGEGGADIYARRLGDSTEVPVAAGRHMEMSPALSPDGRWLAYVSNESGGPEVYVRPFPAGEARWQLSNGGGILPAWSRAGDKLYYFRSSEIYGRIGGDFVEAEVRSGATFSAGEQRVLFPSVFASTWFDVAPDGRRFVMAVRRQAEGEATVVVVDNWFTELRERVAGKAAGR